MPQNFSRDFLLCLQFSGNQLVNLSRMDEDKSDFTVSLFD